MSFSHPAHLSSVVDIPIHCPIVTAQTVSSIVAAVLDLLLFERKQIPLVYQTFKFMVEKFTAEKPGSGHGGGDSGDWDDYLVERVRNDAVQTLNSIKAMKRVRNKSYKQIATVELNYFNRRALPNISTRTPSIG